MDTPKPLLIPSADGSLTKLKSVREIPGEYRGVFPFAYFNALQSKLFDKVMYSDNPIVVCSPTGSGKTVLFELCIIRLLLKSGVSQFNQKVVYMAPIKALCNERYQDWNKKFGPFGLRCTELTGDTDFDDFQELQYSNIVFTTPEKWDSMTRKWKDHKSLIQSVRLFMIDEVHLLNDNARGATMEAVVSRMKTVQVAINNEICKTGNQVMRFVAVSATIPNVDDIAAWLDTGLLPAFGISFGNEYRPVELRKVVLGYPMSERQSDFKFDLTLSYKLSSIIQTYSDNKPSLVFCCTRKSAVQAAGILVKDARFIMNSQQKQRLLSYANSMHDSKLQDYVQRGCGYHHAGLHLNDRKRIEEIFSNGDLPVLFCTSTLAMGVNLPAHLVVIKGTMHYEMSNNVEYPEAQILQMMGRAGRPQFDTSATAVVMTKIQNKKKYETLVSGNQSIESSLHHHLTEHLNVEIVLGTIENADVAQDWLKSTFLYRRMQQNPKYYGAPEGLDKDALSKRFQAMCLRALKSLQTLHLVLCNDNGQFISTEIGKLMANYCINFETLKLFSGANGHESMADMIKLLSRAEEFKEMTVRQNEKKVLNMLNKDKKRTTIRFPLPSKISSTAMKINCLLQSALGCLSVTEFSLLQDTAKIFQIGQRISRFMMEYFLLQSNFQTALNSVLLCKCIRAKLWENSIYVSRQLEKIGASLSAALVAAGLTTFIKIEETNPREIELIVNRHPPFGSQVKQLVSSLPKFDVIVKQEGELSLSQAHVLVKVVLLNKKDQVHPLQYLLLIGDSDNRILFKQKISIYHFQGSTWFTKVIVNKTSKTCSISINLINLQYVGLDVQTSFTPGFTRNANEIICEKTNLLGQEISCSKAKPLVECNHRCINKLNCGHRCCKAILQRMPDSNTNLRRLPMKRSISSASKHDVQPSYEVSLKNVTNDFEAYAYNRKRSVCLKNEAEQNNSEMNKRRKLLDGGMLSQVDSFQNLRAYNSLQDDPSASNLYVDFSIDQKLVDENGDQFGGYEEDFYKDSHTPIPILEDEIERSATLQHVVPVACDRKSDQNLFEFKCFDEVERTSTSIHDSFSSGMNNFRKSSSSKSSLVSDKTICKTLKTRGRETQNLEPCFNLTSNFSNKYVSRNQMYGDQYFKTLEAHAEYLKKLSSLPRLSSPTFNITESIDLNDSKISVSKRESEISVVPKRDSTDRQEYFNGNNLTMRYTDENDMLLINNCFDTMNSKGSQSQYEVPDVLNVNGSKNGFEEPDVLNMKETRQKFFDLTKKYPDMIKVPVVQNEVCPFVLQKSSLNLCGKDFSCDKSTSSISNQMSCGFDGKCSKDGTESICGEFRNRHIFDVENEASTLRMPLRVEDSECYNENLDLNYSFGKNQANSLSHFQTINSPKSLAQIKRENFSNRQLPGSKPLTVTQNWQSSVFQLDDLLYRKNQMDSKQIQQADPEETFDFVEC